MIEVRYTTPEVLTITNSDKKNISFDTHARKVLLDDFEVQKPWEYEKSGNLLEVQKYQDLLFYKFLIDSKHIIIISSDAFELKEDVVGFFGDVDVLIITGSKDAVKIFEHIEAKVVIPYGEGKDIFLNTLWQRVEPVNKHKVGADLEWDRTEFVNLN